MKYFKICIIFLIILVCIFIKTIIPKEENEVLKSEKINNIVSSNAISMLYETEAGSGEYQISNDTSWPSSGYIFNERLSKCENGGTLSWNEETKRIIMQTNKSDKCYVYFDKEPEIMYFADYIKNLYTFQGENGMYYHDSSLANSAEDNSYRYAGANPNNYVCFGSCDEVCSSDNLYRIIGVFDDKVKLIKSTSYGKYVWDSGNDNTWSTSDIRSTLNTTYYNSLGVTWQNKIATHTWKVGGMIYGYSITAKQYYDIEVGSSSGSTTDSMKIGLMYVSDYGFAASPNYWATALYAYNAAINSNWLYLETNEWTISNYNSGNEYAYSVYSTGSLHYFPVYMSNVARPCFYLIHSTTFISGSGTSSDPFRIN